MAESFEPTSKSLIDWLSERTNRDSNRIRDLEIARLGKVWVSVGQLTGIYTWQGTFDDAGGNYFPFSYRLFDKDHLQVKGTMTGGTSGTVGFTLLPPFWPSHDISIWGDVWITGVVKLAVIQIDSTNGECTINYDP